MSRFLRMSRVALGLVGAIPIARSEPSRLPVLAEHVAAGADLACERRARVDTQRRHRIAALRQQAHRRLEAQRAAVRLVRERLRDLAALMPRPGS